MHDTVSTDIYISVVLLQTYNPNKTAVADQQIKVPLQINDHWYNIDNIIQHVLKTMFGVWMVRKALHHPVAPCQLLYIESR